MWERKGDLWNMAARLTCRRAGATKCYQATEQPFSCNANKTQKQGGRREGREEPGLWKQADVGLIPGFSISSVMNLGRRGAYMYCGLIVVFTYARL